MPETGDLRVSEAVALAHALVARLADLEGIRILFVKGPTAEAVAARPTRPSTDVDVLCEPDGFERLGSALKSCGWRLRVPETANQQLVHAAKYLFEHSVHYIHDEWPCDIDVHYNFPGFLAPDAAVFDALWVRHATVEVAHVPVPCADFLGQTAVVGLHALRDPGRGRSQTDLDFLTSSLRARGRGSCEQLSDLAAETGCSETLGPLLKTTGAATAPSRWSDPEQLRRWAVRTEYGNAVGMPWLIELRRASWSRKPALVRRGLFPPDEELLSGHVGLRATRLTIARLHVRRWHRVLARLPLALRAARQAERRLR